MFENLYEKQITWTQEHMFHHAYFIIVCNTKEYGITWMLGDRNLLVKLPIYTMECYTLIINNKLAFVVAFYLLFKNLPQISWIK